MENKNDSYNQNDASERIKDIRVNFRFSRRYLFEKYGLSENTLKKLESSDRKITEKSINKLINIYKKENIVVTKEWIMHGKGEKPRYIFPPNSVDNIVDINFVNNDEILTNKEVEFFERNHENAKVIILEDNDMAPRYKKGDYVGGKEISKNNYVNLENIDCIVLVNGQDSYILRTVNKEDDNSFRLSIRNKNSKNMRPVIYKAKLSFVAPVIWIRRPHKFK